MTRAFRPDPLPDGLLDELLDLARRVPSAGNTQATEFLALEGPAQTGAYWDVTLPVDRRDGFAFAGLLAAPALVVVYADPDAYVARYAEPDKAPTGLGRSADAWAQPYWTVDAAFAALALQYAAIDRGLGVLFFGVFEHERAVAAAFGVPASRQAIGTVALGFAATSPLGRSAARARPPLERVVHRGRW